MLASSNTQNRNPAMKFALKPPPGQHFRIVGAEIQGQRIAFHGNAINDDGRRIVREKPKVTPETPRLSKGKQTAASCERTTFAGEVGTETAHTLATGSFYPRVASGDSCTLV